jgi:hypothetical protein
MIDSDRDVVEAMIRSGGSFVRALGLAAQLADDENLARIKGAFPHYWKTYSETAELLRRRPARP